MRNYVTIKQLLNHYPGLTLWGVREWVRNRKQNGLAAAIIKINRKKILVDLDAFEAWIESHREKCKG